MKASFSAGGYRPELQGLRALAVTLVVCYHVWLDRVSGGVDVFFVITGFLIIGQLSRAIERGAIAFRPMWGRMIRRLFPAALTVLAAVMVAGFFLLPEHRWLQTIREVFAAALYGENWRLVADSTDYFAQHDTASVVQHFWSLSIQGQFYLVMPIVVALLAGMAHRAGWRPQRVLTLAVAVLFAASLSYSVWLTGADQAMAYFHSLTRVWEFMLGGLVALLGHRVVLPVAVRILLGWLGVIALISCGLLLRVGSEFPGYIALWPTMAAVLVLLAGTTESRLGADRWLSSRPLEFIGDISYSLYLWHWPVLVLYLTVTDQQAVGVFAGAVIIAASAWLAVVTHYLVAEPARKARFGHSSSGGAYRLGCALLVAVMTVAGSWMWYGWQRVEAVAVSGDDPKYPGAMARAGVAVHDKGEGADEGVEPGPSMVTLRGEFADLPDGDCSPSRYNERIELCSTPDAATATKRVVVVGDSHAQQNLAALQPVAQRQGWQLVSMVGGGCPFSEPSPGVAMSESCVRANADRTTELERLRPDAVVTMATYQVRQGRTEWTPPGFVAQWRKLSAAGIPVVAVRDHPRFDFDPARCAVRHGVDAEQCTVRRDEFYRERPPYTDIRDMPANVRFVDLVDYYCENEYCPPVIGNVWVYMDPKHLSASYMRTMAPVMERELLAALSW
ncbi:MAG: acyltransferase family protein [Actinophytocola sp.]|nr:acyltransferase family protein [Actinophytocola sp.]